MFLDMIQRYRNFLFGKKKKKVRYLSFHVATLKNTRLLISAAPVHKQSLRSLLKAGPFEVKLSHPDGKESCQPPGNVISSKASPTEDASV